MTYISVNVDVDINADDLNENDLIEVLEDKLADYKRAKKFKQREELINSIKELIEAESEEEEIEEMCTIQDWLINQALQKLKSKYTLEQLENL